MRDTCCPACRGPEPSRSLARTVGQPWAPCRGGTWLTSISPCRGDPSVSSRQRTPLPPRRQRQQSWRPPKSSCQSQSSGQQCQPPRSTWRQPSGASRRRTSSGMAGQQPQPGAATSRPVAQPVTSEASCRRGTSSRAASSVYGAAKASVSSGGTSMGASCPPAIVASISRLPCHRRHTRYNFRHGYRRVP